MVIFHLLPFFQSSAALIQVSLFFKRFPLVSSVSSSLRNWLMSSSHFSWSTNSSACFCSNAEFWIPSWCFFLSTLTLGAMLFSLLISVSFFFEFQSNKECLQLSSCLPRLLRFFLRVRPILFFNFCRINIFIRVVHEKTSLCLCCFLQRRVRYLVGFFSFPFGFCHSLTLHRSLILHQLCLRVFLLFSRFCLHNEAKHLALC